MLARRGRAVGSSVVTTLASVLPYSVVVTNNSLISLTGIDIRFSIGVEGRTVIKHFFYNSLESPSSPIISPQQSRLFTPLKRANEVAARIVSTQGKMSGGGSVLFSGDATTMRDLAAAQQLTISVDLILTVDGQVLGLDRAGTIKKYTQMMSEYSDMRNECLKRLSRGDSDTSIEQWLAPRSQQILTRDAETNVADHRFMMQKRLATEWLALLVAQKRSSLLASLTAATPEKLFWYLTFLKR